MLFSIIIPAYNAAKTIGYCLNSVISQDFPADEFEVIVVDDCSPDRQNTVISTYTTNCIDGGGGKSGPIVKLIKHKENKRQGGAMNTALKAAKGDWIMFLDADDYWCSSQVLKTLATLISQNQDAEIIESISHTDLPSYTEVFDIRFVPVDSYATGIDFLLTNKYSGYVWRSAY